LEALGITRKTIDPVPGFSYYKRDSKDNPTGSLLEDTVGAAIEELNVTTGDVVIESTALVIETLHSYGVTFVFDAGAVGYDALLPTVLETLEGSGDMTVRIVGAYRSNGTSQSDAAVKNALK
jgi:predicted amidohydrolase YtcJ